MTQVIVYTCSHKRAVSLMNGDYVHLAVAGRAPGSVCDGYVFRSKVDILDSRTTVIRTKEQYRANH